MLSRIASNAVQTATAVRRITPTFGPDFQQRLIVREPLQEITHRAPHR
jgi:hypothetical protein